MEITTRANATYEIGDHKIHLSRLEVDRNDVEIDLHIIVYQVNDDTSKYLFYSGDSVEDADEVYNKLNVNIENYEVVPNKTGVKYLDSFRLKEGIEVQDPPKFIVINRKFLDKLTETDHKALQKILDKLECKHEYLVVNKDEAYSDQVLKLILKGEGIIKSCSSCKHLGKITNGIMLPCDDCGPDKNKWEKVEND